MGTSRIPVEERFWSKVKKTSTCWLWQRQLNNKGYGCFAYMRIPGRNTSRNMYAHRVAWVMTYGPIPDGLNVLHKCDVPACVNPEHLFLGTQADNMADCVRKGRLKINRNKAKLSPDQVRAIRNDPRKHHIIAAAYGLKQRKSVWSIKNGRTWPDIK